MKTLFLINDVREVVAKMSTTLLIAAAARRHPTWVCGIDDFSVVGGESIVGARRVNVDTSEITTARVAASLRRQPPTPSPLHDFDLVAVRTNPGRDGARAPSHTSARHFLRDAQRAGVCVVNTPFGLERAETKMYLTSLPPAVVPELIVSRSVKQIEKWAGELGDSIVLKPIAGTRGNDVFVVHQSDRSNLRQMLGVVTRDGYAMAQRYLPEAKAGDTRVLVVGGRILEVDGRSAAVARVPARGDFRSNVHAGGKAKGGVVTEGMRQVVAAIGEQLVADGLYVVGLDFIADLIIEVNVFSPGGFGNAMEREERDFAGALIDALERLQTSRGGDGDGDAEVVAE
jgi:glutathione synthase